MFFGPPRPRKIVRDMLHDALYPESLRDSIELVEVESLSAPLQKRLKSVSRPTVFLNGAVRDSAGDAVTLTTCPDAMLLIPIRTLPSNVDAANRGDGAEARGFRAGGVQTMRKLSADPMKAERRSRPTTELRRRSWPSQGMML